MHLPGIGVVAALLALPFLFLLATDVPRQKEVRAISIGMCAYSALFTAWVVYAIYNTMLRNRSNPSPAFGEVGYILLIVLTVLLGLAAIAMGIMSAI